MTVDGVPGRVLALDPGTVRIGVAVSDSARTMAFPRDAVPAGPAEVATCAALARELGATRVIVGLALTMAGARGPAATHGERLAEGLRAALAADGVDVELCDERLTTVTAQRRLFEAGRTARASRAVVDGAAAVVLLDSWMAR